MNEVYHNLLWFQLLISPIILLSLLFITAPYGRHYKGGWGLQMSTRWAWVIMELPAVLTIFYMWLIGFRDLASPIVVFLIIWQIHYLYRTFYFPFQLKDSKKSFPALLVLFAITFNVINGFINGFAVFHTEAIADTTFYYNWNFWIGVVIFFIGFIMHVHSDRTIINLRKDPSSANYSIPYGGMFRWVTNPNYLGEVIQWLGWAILTWSIAGLAFALFTFCNLFPRAIANHKWYKSKFEDFPPDRKVFFPGIY